VKPLDARLLEALRESRVHLPASELAAQIGAPLATVEARVIALRDAGFEIDERPGLGIRLIAAPDRLIADDLTARLGRCPLAREIVVFAETESTNDIASQLGRHGAGGGIVVFAEHQTAGRGRFGRRWDSASHRGLWFSLLVRPAVPVSHWVRLTTWAAAGIAAAIDDFTGIRPAIKWPNDIFIGEKKVAGILAESGVDSGGSPFAVIGIGVNVNHQAEDFPSELAGRATSLQIAAGRSWDRTDLAAAILRALDARLAAVAGDFPSILAEAESRSMLFGRWIRVQTGAHFQEGIAERLDESGRLILRLADGETTALGAGEVTIASR
jgi:BirA family biotin operon repressor/biotin-[acetyl-CoA-carboxylase] ligase